MGGDDHGDREMTAGSVTWTSEVIDIAMRGAVSGIATEIGIGTGAIATTEIFERDAHHSEQDHRHHSETFGTGTAMGRLG